MPRPAPIRRVICHLFILATSVALAPACGAPASEPGAGATFEVSVAPLKLGGITNAEYTIAVTNGDGEPVWTRDLSADRFGDGAGSIAYVGPCDAEAPAHTVTLTLTALYDADGRVPAGDYVNPTPVSRPAMCSANADVPVRFDITLARRAEQGFFDVAIELDDVFCSAKLDCLDADTGEELALLHNPLDGGKRDLTAVLGFACAGGPGADAWLYMDDVRVLCGGPPARTVVVDVRGPGNVDLTALPSQNPDAYLFGAAIFRGGQRQGGHAYWNVALGLNRQAFAEAGSCTVSARATASSRPFAATMDGFALPSDGVYPVVAWSVELSDGAGRVCGTHTLDGGDGVATTYVGALAPGSGPGHLKHRLTPDGAVESAGPATVQARWGAAAWDASVWGP